MSMCCSRGEKGEEDRQKDGRESCKAATGPTVHVRTRRNSLTREIGGRSLASITPAAGRWPALDEEAQRAIRAAVATPDFEALRWTSDETLVAALSVALEVLKPTYPHLPVLRC